MQRSHPGGNLLAHPRVGGVDDTTSAVVPASTNAIVVPRPSSPPLPPPVKRLAIGTPGGKQAKASSSSSSTYVGNTNAQTGSVRSSPVHVTITTMSHSFLNSVHKPLPESKPFNPQTIQNELRARVQRERTSGDVPDIPPNPDMVETSSPSPRALRNATVNRATSLCPPVKRWYGRDCWFQKGVVVGESSFIYSQPPPA